MPNPPRRVGSANKSRSRSLGGALPVQAGISWHLIVSSRGCIREPIFGFVLASYVNLWIKPRMKAAKEA